MDLLALKGTLEAGALAAVVADMFGLSMYPEFYFVGQVTWGERMPQKVFEKVNYEPNGVASGES